ncbi:MAG TPA: helix-turn-helix domain-containing protein [Reyranella sp.]|nr:helix-turn-helix domain-containing protein [Reyranella sp.]
MIYELLASVQSVSRDWRAEAERRRKVAKSDPVADALDWCAGELDTRCAMLKAECATVSVEQYAAAHGIAEQTVRNWIHQGQLPAERAGRGYRIAPNAVRLEKAS